LSVAGLVGCWQHVVLQISVDCRTHLFDGQFFEWIIGRQIIPPLSQATAEQIAQLGYEPVPVDTTPTANLEVIQTKFFLGGSEAGFDRPAAKRNPEQPSKSHTIAANDSVRKKVFDFAGADISSDDESVLPRRKFVFCFSPEPSPFDFPDFGATISVFDAVALPVLLSKNRRVGRQVIDAAADIGFANSRNTTWPTIL
jgi:hypothetical protein